MKYRPEVDGLRAVAVIPVILFHAGFESFAGGYVGVDVFFVISGYLITSILVEQLQGGHFSLTGFYLRRMRRILPALYLVMAASFPLAWLLLTPSDLRDFSQSLVAVALFSSNLLFLHEAGYWNGLAELKPLIHTWSLGVEEQYYLLFPLFLLGLWRLGQGSRLIVFGAIGVVGLALSQWAVLTHPEAAFYLLPFRLWELALGCLIALWAQRAPTLFTAAGAAWQDGTRQALALLGLALILAAMAFYDRLTPFPGLAALLPTLGAGLILLFSGPRTLVGRWLSARVPVLIGLCSYSAYLWHQPLLAFAQHGALEEPQTMTRLTMCVIAGLLAWLTWRWVERPFRDRRSVSDRRMVALAVGGLVLFVALGSAGHLSGGWSQRVDPRLRIAALSEVCEPSLGTLGPACRMTPGDRDLVLVYGDSHARALAGQLKARLGEAGMGSLLALNDGCLPLAEVYRENERGSIGQDNQACLDFVRGVDAMLEQTPIIRQVVMIGRWTLGVEGVRFDNGEGGVERGSLPARLQPLVNGQPVRLDGRQRLDALGRKLQASVERMLLDGRRVVLVYPVPEAGWSVPAQLQKIQFYRGSDTLYPLDGSTSRDRFWQRNQRTYGLLDAIGPHSELRRTYPEQRFCGGETPDRCRVHEAGIPLYRDDDHPYAAGAAWLADDILSQLRLQ